MAITYTWEVTGIKTRADGPHDNAVVQTTWKKVGTNEAGLTGEFLGATPFSAADVPVAEFVPLDQLTEESVLEWIKSAVVGDYESHVNSQIQYKIERQIAVDTRMPWGPEEYVPPDAHPVKNDS
jgi:hypothetical protein